MLKCVLDKLKKSGIFNKEAKLIEEGKCPFCAKLIDEKTEFRDEISRQEFKISGLCQACQDKIFN
jgi:hypothetical protein